MDDGPDLARLTAEMFIAYVTNNKVDPLEVENVVRSIRTAIAGRVVLGEAGEGEEGVAAARSEPAVPIEESVQPDYVTCLEDGRRFKSLKRHLSLHGLTPQEYRERWGLPADYPMVAPKYAKARSRLAKKIGLGRKRGSSG
jgi:predicted transcriptional regulator